MKDIEILYIDTFLDGQYQLHKQKFVDTDDSRYLENMNDFNKARELFKFMQRKIREISLEKRELKKDLDNLKKII